MRALFAKIYRDKVVRWCPDDEFFAIFLHPVFSDGRVQHVSDLHLNSHKGHTVCGSMITSNLRRLRIGEEKRWKIDGRRRNHRTKI